MKIDIISKNIAPLHHAVPESARYDTKNGKIVGETANAAPLVRTRHMPVYVGDKMVRLPIFSANGIAGRLRRKAAYRVLDAMRENAKGSQVVRPTIHSMSCGSPSSSPNMKVTLDDIEAANADAFLGLFGGGPRMLRKKFSVGDMIPIDSSTLEHGMVPMRFQDLANSPKYFHGCGCDGYTYVICFTKVDDITRFTNANMPDYMENYEEEARKWIESIESSQAERKQDKEKKKDKDVKVAKDDKDEKSKKVILGAQNAIEVVVPGVNFYTSIDIRPHATEASIGLLIHAIKDFTSEKLGGWLRSDFGKMAYRISVEGEPLLLDETGDINPHFKPYLEAWDQDKKTVTSAGLNSIHS